MMTAPTMYVKERRVHRVHINFLALLVFGDYARLDTKYRCEIAEGSLAEAQRWALYTSL